jgi:hypothetical protein
VALMLAAQLQATVVVLLPPLHLQHTQRGQCE